MEPFIGEIILFAGNFAPKGWSFCNGQLLSISVNAVLFSILGTTYGGDGIATFGLPDLRGRVPVHPGSGVGLAKKSLGEMGGSETIMLTLNQMPAHSHLVSATMDITVNYLEVGQKQIEALITNQSVKRVSEQQKGESTTRIFNKVSSDTEGQSLPHNNMQPFQCINFIIALQGIYPARN